MFLEFIISFLELLEKHVEDGSLNKQLKKADQGGFQIGVSQDLYKDTVTKNLRDVNQCLRRLRSIRAYSGDCFFHTLARTFIAHTVIPYDHKPTIASSNLEGINTHENHKLVLRNSAGGGQPILNKDIDIIHNTHWN